MKVIIWFSDLYFNIDELIIIKIQFLMLNLNKEDQKILIKVLILIFGVVCVVLCVLYVVLYVIKFNGNLVNFFILEIEEREFELN